jgi:ABC-type polar amino acid transport system ATPase subunit
MNSVPIAPSASAGGVQPVVIRAENIVKSFGAVTVLKGVSLSVFQGEVVCIVGPSGGGKSTFLRMLNGLESFDAGSAQVEGVSLPASRKDLLTLRRKVGMVFQSFNLFPHLSIRENVALAPIRNRGMSRREASERADLLLERVRIGEQADKYPSQLSGGQQQRAAIARALAMEPKALLFDEPTSALDPEMVTEVLDVMKELAKAGMTMIIVTHEMGFAREVADRMVFMADGSAVFTAPPAQFFDRSGDPRLTSFLAKVL